MCGCIEFLGKGRDGAGKVGGGVGLEKPFWGFFFPHCGGKGR